MTLRLLGSSGTEDFIELVENELHNLVLEDHVHCDVAGLLLGPEQGGAEHYGRALDRHAVQIPMFNHSAGQKDRGQE